MDKTQEVKVGYELIDNKFDIIECIGTGVTSSVYKVSHKNLPNKYFALKILNPGLMKNETVAKRFQRELLASYTVNHPNIIRGFDFIRQGSTLAYTMEYADDGSLREKLDEVIKLDHNQVVKLAVQLAAGLSSIHKAGIIHRDLKPENVFLTNTGYYKISDFGIAKLLNGKTLTKHGEILGQVEYSSPEYISENIFDERSDIYSFGLIIYEALVGQRVFEKNNSYMHLLERTKNKVLVPAGFKSEKFEILQVLIEKCCEIDPDNRFQSAEEIIDFLYQNEQDSKEFVLEVSSAHHSIISDSKNQENWNSTLWQGIENKSAKNKKNLLIALTLLTFLYFVFKSFI